MRFAGWGRPSGRAGYDTLAVPSCKGVRAGNVSGTASERRGRRIPIDFWLGGYSDVSRLAWRIVAAGAVMVVGLVLAWVWVPRTAGPHSTSGTDSPPSHGSVTVHVTVFRPDPPLPPSWDGSALAKNVAARLQLIPGLHAPVGESTERDTPAFTLRGEGTTRESRVVITARLYHETETTPIWTATFWRSEGSLSDFAGELASEVAAHLFGHLTTQHATHPKREEP